MHGIHTQNKLSAFVGVAYWMNVDNKYAFPIYR